MSFQKHLIHRLLPSVGSVLPLHAGTSLGFQTQQWEKTKLNPSRIVQARCWNPWDLLKATITKMYWDLFPNGSWPYNAFLTFDLQVLGKYSWKHPSSKHLKIMIQNRWQETHIQQVPMYPKPTEGCASLMWPEMPHEAITSIRFWQSHRSSMWNANLREAVKSIDQAQLL